ncbi:Colicin I receptor precursor [Mariniflexile rhizosphaerae]|uniref:TonB-dependent receptor n=1 Tax=unclassified Mariniflexile TaxID=2643887 RepID=UPI000CA7597C|nr:TonB-dependent receptor [Mariniflexile sp. TRM1-10]AXP80407.1 Colicin I receptor precursor [Mariniflexile sp. TRM1-10]PLB20574.1 MAG: TonB-dependent receptor [Flavobacteriaceae bacterium FS1-H7996/R]
MRKDCVLLLITFIYSLATFTQNGNIKGVIADENGIAVPGATVLIEELKKGAVSDFDGTFTIIGIPEGTYHLSIKYLGYSDFKKEAIVSNSETTTLYVTLSSKNTELDEVEITGYSLGGQARALNAQKNKQNITNIVSTDQIGKFPDANIGDAVKRIPGITMQVDQGEARNIIIRGLSPQLNSVTLNGSRIPSAEGDNRNVQMDLIPADMIQTIEVSKAITPDMDADALGGSVNLITRTSPQGFRLSATAGSGINYITNKRILNGSFLLGDKSNDGKFGYMLSASFNDNDFGSDNVEAEWEDEFEYNAFDDEDNLQEVDVNPYAKVFEIREYLVQRIRRSFSANFDYKLNDNSNIYFKSIYNWRDDRENRFRLEHEILDGEDIEPGDFTVDGTGNLTSFPVEVKRQSKGGIDNGRNKNRRLEDQRMFNFSLGGEHLANTLQIDWMASLSKASEERLNERYLEYESEYGVAFNNDADKPLFIPLFADDADFNNFEFNELTEENQYTEEKDLNLFANFKLPLTLFQQEDGFLKFGLRARLKNKNRDNDFTEYSPQSAAFEFLGGIPTRNYSDSDFLAGSQYAVGTFATSEFLGSLKLNDTTQFEAENLPEEYLTANFDVDENVYAGYAMTNQKLSDKLSLLVGLRLEHTKINSIGNELIFDVEGDYAGTNQLKDESSYTNVLPGLHLKYDVSNNTVLRFAWTNTLARPNYVDLVPYREINNEDEEIYLGNSELEPTTSMNFDVMAERYFKSVGILSAGLFYKDIQDFVYTSQSENTNGYEVYQPLNGEGATIFGAEFSLQRQLDFLPGFAKNFNIYLNYTYLTSDAKGIKNEDGETRNDLDLPQTAPNMFNASLGYANKRLSLRLSGNYSDSYIDEIGGRAFEDRYYDEQFFLDFNANVSINKNLSLYADLNNITNQPLRYFQGVKSRTMQMEYYGRRLTFGLKYDLFKKN